MRDPLGMFLHEKVAAAEPTFDLNTPNYVTKDPDPESLDPGERAMAGLLAVGGSIAAKVIPRVANWALRREGLKESIPWPNAAPMTGSSIADTIQRGELPRSKLMGLWDIGARRVAPRNPAEAIARAETGQKLLEIRNVVDSFINEHKLTEKGVRLNFSKGPLGGVLGPRYHIPTKQVFLPRVGKEVALHELGHAADYTGSMIGKFRGIAEPILRRGVMTALPIAMIAGDRIKEFLPGTVDDKAIEFMQDHAPAIMGATLAATSLYPEAKASFLAINHIRKTEGPLAARAAMKKLIPAFGTYLLGAIPAVVGMALARKYLRSAREEKQGIIDDYQAQQEQEQDLQKISGVLRDIGSSLKSSFLDVVGDLGHVGKQIGSQSWSMLQQPGLAKRVYHASKEVGASPEFVYGALSAAIPATVGSLYLYGTSSGKQIRERIHPEHRDNLLAGKRGGVVGTKKIEESWREQHPLRFAGLVAAGAALSGGILSKFLSDLQRVL